MSKRKRLVILVLLMPVLASVFCCREAVAWGNNTSMVMPNTTGGVNNGGMGKVSSWSTQSSAVSDKNTEVSADPKTFVSQEARETAFKQAYPFVLDSHLGFDPRLDSASAGSPDVNKFAVIVVDTGFTAVNFASADRDLIVDSLLAKGWPESNINWVVINSSAAEFDLDIRNPPASNTESDLIKGFWDTLFPPASENILMDSNDQVLVVFSSEGRPSNIVFLENWGLVGPPSGWPQGTAIDRFDPNFVSGYIQRLPGHTALAIDSCYSGELLDDYSSSRNMVLTASNITSSSQEISFDLLTQGANLAQGILRVWAYDKEGSEDVKQYSKPTGSVFLTQLAEGISQKDSLEEAFIYAKEHTEFSWDPDNLELGNWNAYLYLQSPQIKDNQPEIAFKLNYLD